MIVVVEMSNALMETPNTSKNQSKNSMVDYFQEYAEKLRAEFEQEKKRAVNVATR